MKLTPEQKAFYEYGREIQNLHHLLNRIRLSGRRSFGLSYKYLSDREKTILKRDYFLTGHIKKVRQKRAACRAWTIPSAERICENCAHEGTHPYATPCSECFRCSFAQAYEGFSDNWEPRKEGNDETPL